MKGICFAFFRGSLSKSMMGDMLEWNRTEWTGGVVGKWMEMEPSEGLPKRGWTTLLGILGNFNGIYSDIYIIYIYIMGYDWEIIKYDTIILYIYIEIHTMGIF